MQERFATFFVTTGRCGTQWLWRNLANAYGDLAIVTHDPLPQADYQARELLWSGDVASLRNPKPILDHVAKIQSVLRSTRYIETGGFCRGAFPYLVETLGEETQIVHLVRHPTSTARSYRKAHNALKEAFRRLRADEGVGATAERFFVDTEPPPFDRRLKTSNLPGGLGSIGQTPFDPGSRFQEYRSRWNDLSVIEQDLYRWLEINAWALSYEKTAKCPWLRIKYEDLFTEQGITTLISFLRLPLRKVLLAELAQRVDKFGLASYVSEDTLDLERHPAVVKLMRDLSYTYP